MPPPPSILVTIDENPLTKVKAKTVSGIIIDEDLTFTQHIEHSTQKCKIAYNRLTLYPDMSAHLAFKLYKAFIRYKLEFGSTVLERGATSLNLLRTMKSTPTDALESKLSTLPTDLHLEELQSHEAVKLLIKEDEYIQSNIIGRSKTYNIGSPFENVRSLTKQIL